MNDVEKAKLTVLRDLFRDGTSTLCRKTVAEILTGCMQQQGIALHPAPDRVGSDAKVKRPGEGGQTGDLHPAADRVGSNDTRVMSDRSDESDPSDARNTCSRAPETRVRAALAEMAIAGLPIAEMLRSILRDFRMTHDELARMLRINQGTLSRYLREGTRAKSVSAALQQVIDLHSAAPGGSSDDTAKPTGKPLDEGGQVGDLHPAAPGRSSDATARLQHKRTVIQKEN